VVSSVSMLLGAKISPRQPRELSKTKLRHEVQQVFRGLELNSTPPWAGEETMRNKISGLLAACALTLGCGTTIGNPPDNPDITIYDAVPQGSLVITEIQANPHSSRPQYIEFLVVSDEAVDLKGCQIVDGGSQEHRFSVAEEVMVEPGLRFIAAPMGDLAGPESGEGNLSFPVLLQWEDMALSPTDAKEELSINCPDGTGARHSIDSLAFDWSSLDIARGHSLQLAGDSDAGENDSLDNWCGAPSDIEAIFAVVDGVPDYGTPLEETYCNTLSGKPVTEVGQVVINELLVDEFPGLREWFEIHNPGDQDRDISGCEIGDAPASEPESAQFHAIEAANGETVIEAGGFLLLAKSGWDVTEDGSVIAQYGYTSLSFNNSEEQHLWIDCPSSDGSTTLTIDSVSYNWSSYGSDFEGRSLVLDPSAADSASNDDPTSWCLASDGTPFWSQGEGEDLKEAWGTPGEGNQSCPVPDPFPLPEEVVFTEILVRSAGASIGHNEEWFELKNLASHSVSLDGCTLVNDDESGITEHLITPVFGLTVASNDYVILSRTSAEDSIACGLPAEYFYGNSISFSNSAPEQLSLLCGDGEQQVLIDSISFDGGVEEFSPGHPWQLSSTAEDAILNDDPSAWCAEGSPETFSWSCSVGDDTNYGTPGSSNNCL